MRSFLTLLSTLAIVAFFAIAGKSNGNFLPVEQATADSTGNAVLFDDFNYTAPDDPTLSDHGWIVRTGGGWPGIPDAVWRAENVDFVADPDTNGNQLMQMTSSTDDGETYYQTQVCQQRKFYEGTYATRVHFSDTPSVGNDGDNVVETFYLIFIQERFNDLADTVHTALQYVARSPVTTKECREGESEDRIRTVRGTSGKDDHNCENECHAYTKLRKS